MNYPTRFPFKVVNNLVAITPQLDLVGDKYLQMRALLTDHHRELERFAELIGKDDKKEVIFVGIKTREDLERQKKKKLVELVELDSDREDDEKSPPQIDPAVQDYLQAPVPEGLPPIIIQVQPADSPEDKFGMGGGIAGLVFTLWLVYNMSPT